MQLNQFLERHNPSNVFSSMDVQFAKFLLAEFNQHDYAVAGLLVSHELSKGNVCLDFELPNELLSSTELNKLYESLLLLNDSHDFMDNGPMVLEGRKLYLEKYHHYEQQLANNILARLKPMPWLPEQMDKAKASFSNLFKLSDSAHLETEAKDTHHIDWQAIAAYTSARSQFSVISGGPGTGKTTTVIRLLAILSELYQGHFKRKPIIKLAAPTGKAANRLSESIIQAKHELAVDDSIKQTIPEEALTLHRLLGRQPSGQFKFHRFNPLHLDVLLIDEASMVDLPMMAKVLDAMPVSQQGLGQIILLGDKDQLASVEAGSVLADICDNEVDHGFSENTAAEMAKVLPFDLVAMEQTNDVTPPLIEATGAEIRNHICHLRKSYRFDANSGIGHLAKAANSGDGSAWQTELAKGHNDVTFLELSDSQYEAFIESAAAQYSNYLELVTSNDGGLTEEQAIQVHQAFSTFQVLCALKDGPLGVEGLNEKIEQSLKRQGVIGQSNTFYLGRPVIILENDYGLNLYNGDVGIILPQASDSGPLAKACFMGAGGQVRWLQPSRLPKHETVFAMTIHKSQGSEFDHCALALPDYSVPIMSKELIYTGITRAKKQLTLLAKTQLVNQALGQKVMRASGLGQRLWNSGQSTDDKNSNTGQLTAQDNVPKEQQELTSSKENTDPNGQISLF